MRISILDQEVFKCDQCEFTALKKHKLSNHKLKHSGK